MAGENFFFFCIALLLFWNLWDRIKHRRRLASLYSRIRQLEELLLEVCAVLEENWKKEKPETSRGTRLVPAVEEQEELAEPGEPDKPGRPKEPEKLEAPEEPETQVSPLPFVGGKDNRQAENVATAEKRPAGEEKRENAKGIGERKAEKTGEEETEKGPVPAIRGQAGEEDSTRPELQAADRRRQVLELFRQGVPVKTIARRIGMGQGEAQLIIDLYARREKEK